jgi:hypothetical protein
MPPLSARRRCAAVLLALALAARAGGAARAQPPPQLGPALNQAMAAMPVAQAALEALLATQDAARAASGDPAVQAALTTLAAQATALAQAAQRLKAINPPPGAAAAAPPDKLAACHAANAKLLAAGHDILHLYETQSFRSLLVRSYEPLLGLWRVELENIVQDQDDRLREQEIPPDSKESQP